MVALVAVVEAVALVAVVATFARLLSQQQRAHARREDMLVAQLFHAVGRPWHEAPADEARRLTLTPLFDDEHPVLLSSPEQHEPIL